LKEKEIAMMNAGIGRGIISGAKNFGKGAFRIPSPKKKTDEKSSNNFRGSAEQLSANLRNTVLQNWTNQSPLVYH
jgi:hypothetical protein